jgi:hypothetical protein
MRSTIAEPAGDGRDRSLTDEELRRVQDLLGRWLLRCRVALAAYNRATTRAVAAERRLGIPSVALSALVATSVFVTLESDPAVGWRIATGVVAVAATVLTALQTFLRQEERAEQFREAARSYGRLRRRIELAMLFPPGTTAEASAVLDDLAGALAEAARGKPNVPQSVWDRADYKIRGRSDARGMRALRLRLGDAIDFGMRSGETAPLAEDHERYFAPLASALIVPLSRIRASTPDSEHSGSIATARNRMREAAAGTRDRRPPLDVRMGDDGGLILVDGNATFAVARQEGWETVPVRIIDQPAELG